MVIIVVIEILKNNLILVHIVFIIIFKKRWVSKCQTLKLSFNIIY